LFGICLVQEKSMLAFTVSDKIAWSVWRAKIKLLSASVRAMLRGHGQ
jgi:hypothetical protein